MNPAVTSRQAAKSSLSILLRERWNQVAQRLETAIPDGMIALLARCAIAAIFFLSGRTKVDGLLTVSSNAYTLFEQEYKLPVVSPEIAAHLATYAEHLFPILLVLGLLTRGAAFALLGMTLVIQVFVYPDAWPTHLSWAGLLVFLLARGGGPLSIDRWLGLK